MTQKMKCIIVDDEPLARDVLEGYAKQMDQLEVIAVCANAVEAFGYLQKHKIDLMFLDIKMPKINGMELLESLNPIPLVVFTTAYREYAIKAFELDAIDYLLKPISLGRFMKSVAKANKFLNGNLEADRLASPTETISKPTPSDEPELLYIKSQRKIVKLDLSEISYLESLNDKVIIHSGTNKINTTQRIGYLAEKLPKKQFIRIHRSFIVSADKVTAFNSIMVEVNGKELPVGRNYRSQAMEVLQDRAK